VKSYIIKWLLYRDLKQAWARALSSPGNAKAARSLRFMQRAMRYYLEGSHNSIGYACWPMRQGETK